MSNKSSLEIKLLNKIERVRTKLNAELDKYLSGKQKDYNIVLEISEYLDELIVQYLEQKEN